MESALVEKSKRFAVRVVRLCKWLQHEKQDYEISRQIIRSGTSIGANIAEAQYAISKADFQSKLYIAMKESAETAYWIDLLCETDYITYSQYRSLKQDNDELLKMLTSATKTTRQPSTPRTHQPPHF